VREYTEFSWLGFELSTCITDTRSVFMEIVRFFHIFGKITVTNLDFWHQSYRSIAFMALNVRRVVDELEETRPKTMDDE